MTDIRIGDRFKVEMEVAESNQNGCWCRYPEHSDTSWSWWVPHAVLLASERIERPIAVGDRVRSSAGAIGQVLAIDEDIAIIKWSDNDQKNGYGPYGFKSLDGIEPALGVSMEGGE